MVARFVERLIGCPSAGHLVGAPAGLPSEINWPGRGYAALASNAGHAVGTLIPPGLVEQESKQASTTEQGDLSAKIRPGKRVPGAGYLLSGHCGRHGVWRSHIAKQVAGS